MFFFDPLYLVIVGPAFIFTLWAQNRVKSSYQEYSKVPSSVGMTGAQIAHRLMQSVGMEGVSVERVGGTLSDHYDPRTRTLRLSEGVYDSASVAAMAIVAHETGHAIQDRVRYPLLVLRTSVVPATQFGSTFGYLLLIGGIMLTLMAGSPFGIQVAWLGLGLYSLTLIFTIVTLPVEFDASKRALTLLEANGISSPKELVASKKVLDAAALTYVAAMATSLLTILYWVTVLMGRRD